MAKMTGFSGRTIGLCPASSRRDVRISVRRSAGVQPHEFPFAPVMPQAAWRLPGRLQRIQL